jgi:hypothetical protein
VTAFYSVKYPIDNISNSQFNRYAVNAQRNDEAVFSLGIARLNIQFYSGCGPWSATAKENKMRTRKSFNIAGILATALVFGFVLAGCATPVGSETPLTPEQQAEQLAADLNAFEAGSATAAGATVKITPGKFVGIGELIVPAGITLDVTADDAALGLGNQRSNKVTLTVDGTVIAGSNGIGLEDCQDEAVINGSGTIRLKGRGHLLSVSSNWNVANVKITLDGVTLAGVPDNDDSLVRVGAGGMFVMLSGAITGNSATNGSGIGGGGVRVENGGTFTMRGGKISGNSANSSAWAGGGGVYVHTNSRFNMQGGEISGNSANGNNASGGGVYVGKDSEFFIIHGGGIISGNSANGTTAKGGGVMLENVRRFFMNRGTIYGSGAGGNANKTTDGSGSPVTGNGAAIWVDTGLDAKWTTEGTYTIGGVVQTPGSAIGTTDETLVAAD